MLELQKFIKENPDNWATLLRRPPYNLLINGRDGMLLFKYVQFASDFSIPLVRESRGIILDAETFEVVAHPFNKFFNFGEVHADDIDLNNSHVIEKVDGSIIKVFYYDGEWRVATNGTIDASDAGSQVDGVTFRDLFNSIIDKQKFYEFTKLLSVDYTYMFEMIHPVSRVVVDYNGKKELVFLGSRNNKTGIESDIFGSEVYSDTLRILELYGIRYPEKYDLNDVSDLSKLAEIAETMNESGTDFEGFIVTEVMDGVVTGRVKIKSAEYLKYHRLAGGSATNIVQILLDNELDEFEVYIEKLPQYIQDDYNRFKEAYNNLISLMEYNFDKYTARWLELNESNVENPRKELALQLQTTERYIMSMVFAHIFHGKSVVDILRGWGAKKVRDLLTRLTRDWNTQ